MWSCVGPGSKAWPRPQAMAPPPGHDPPPGHGPAPSYWPYFQVPPARILKVSPIPVSEHVQWVRVDQVPRVICIFYFPDVSPLWAQFHGSLESDMMTLGLSPKSTGDFWQVDGGLVPTNSEQTHCILGSRGGTCLPLPPLGSEAPQPPLGGSLGCWIPLEQK